MDPPGAQGSGTGNNDQRPRASTSAGEEEDTIPACQSCRKRKLKCSREQPSCSQCLRLAVPCLYDHKKQRPGLRSGAVENLSRRLEVLEKILLDSQGNQKAPLTPQNTQGCLYHASLLIANELKTKGSVAPSENRDDDDDDDDVEHHNTTTRSSKLNCQRSISSSNGDFEVRSSSRANLPRKRKREDEYGWATLDEFESLPPLPSPHILDAIVDTYFMVLQPWIPFLHKPTFRAQLQDPQERPKLTVLLHALVSATLKHVKFIDLGMDQKEAERQVRVSRNVVKLHAMGNLSVENLQALIIIAFDYIGGGQISKAWPIIGSLTRTVEYLRLTVEPDEVQQQSLLRPHTLLEKPKQWTEIEMRRRVFWNVFLFDRFCSVTSGWSTSLTSDDVHRRLPCDGKMWSNGEPALTPYFGIWDKSAARIGNSIAYIRSLYPSQSEQDHRTDSSPGGRGGSASGDVDVSKLGAFAYRIESMESLSQVTSFFLQQHVDFRNRQEVGAWLTRFKELDLRLVHWKMFLPQKWKDSNVSRDVALIKMDPNLTLAHITHNTSMILLHQHIAYPPVDWAEIVKLPSSCSAETCQLAAVETASIAEKYLRYTGGIVNSQFAFCAFVAARVFLVHWRFCNTDLSPEFFSLIDSLQKMSDRWRGYQRHENANEDCNTMSMAGKYVLYLRKLHSKCQNEPNYCMNILGYSDTTTDYDDIGGLLPTSPSQPYFGPLFSPHSPLNNSGEESSEVRNQSLGEDLRFYPHVLSSSRNITSNLNQDQGYQPSFNTNHLDIISNTSQLLPHYASQGLDTNAKDTQSNDIMRSGIVNMNGGKEMIEDELTAMSHSLLGQQFLELDRVITLEGTDFDFDMRNWGTVS